MNFLFAQDFQWLPQGSFFPTQYLDPTACQQSISLMSYEVEGETQQLLYVPISLSMQQQILRAEISSVRRWEMGVEFSIFSQFSIIEAGDTYLGGLQNADYRISSVLHYQYQASTLYRIALFHQSSHLGDDYIIRNAITTPTLNTQNYEQVDVTVLKQLHVWNLRATAGYNISPHTVRKRSLLQVGAAWSHPLKSHPDFALLTGLDMKIYEHNNYRPNLRLAAGIEIGRRTPTPLKILVSYYQGHLPYSTLEYQKVRLFGLSLMFNMAANN